MAIKKPVNKKKSSFEFTGYILGGLKSEKGTFRKWKGFIILEDNKIKAVEGTIDTTSVDTGIKKLNQHLKSPDFFNVKKYPKTTFKAKIKEKPNPKLDGEFTFRGKTQKISAPIKLTNNSISTDFKINTGPFRIKYIGMKKYVKINFKFVI